MGQKKQNKFTSKMPDFSFSAVSDDDLLKLDNQLCFSLYVCSKEIIKKYKPLLEPYGLTYTGYITLMALWEQDDVNVKELGAKLFLDSGTLTPLLKKLEAQGYVARVRDPKDERNMRIRLTQKGIDLKVEAASIPKELLSEVKFGSVKSYLLTQTLHQLMETLIEDEEIKEPEDKSKKNNKK